MSDLPDKQHLYGRYQAEEDRRARLAHKMRHKALDIPDDDMEIQANRTQIGMTWRELGMIALLVAGSVGGTTLYLRAPAPAPPAAPAPIAPAAPDDREYEVRFFDAGGNLISVPHVSARE